MGQGWSNNSSASSVSDKNFVMEQLIPSLIWSVIHNLNKKVAVQITNNSNYQMIGEVRWVSDNEVEITFSHPKTGWVFCN